EDSNKEKVCNVDDPLTELPWLKEIIDGFQKDADAGNKPHARIYRCTFKDGTGFLLERCVTCPDFGCDLMNCEGKLLCTMYGLAGKSCSEFEVDFENKKLIFEIK
ncbi:MAG: hypothetical protein LBR10_02375, partial [Prevotellaceae bacterium]|nr:hypothetical protein [Prevotellaceae bacterium]